jgi:hypothetical protein
VARQPRSHGQHPAERDELEQRDDPASKLLVVGSLGGDEPKRGRNRGGRRTALQQPRDEEHGQLRSETGHEHRGGPEDRTEEHYDLSPIAVCQDSEEDRAGQFGGVETAGEER